MRVPISAELSILSKRARSTFRILPRNGRMAWKRRLRPDFAEPPAESPSTRKISECAGSRSWQSASLPGSEFMSRALLRRVSSLALRAASRASAASTTLATMRRASAGCSSNQRFSFSLMMPSTTGRTSELTSLSLVCEENLGSGTFADSTQVRPSRASSPVSATLSFFAMPLSVTYWLIWRVRAPRKPARWVPPSRCGILLVKHSIVSW